MTAGGARTERRDPTAAAAHIAFWCACAYGAMKLEWALGGELLMRQTPLPRGVRDDLLNAAPGAVAGSWASVALALVGMAAALHLSGRFGPHGRFRRGLLLAGSWAGCAFMVVRALGLLGYGFAGDLRVLAGWASVPPDDAGLAHLQAQWDLLLWSPYWLLFGTCWGIAARRYRRLGGGGRAQAR
ncbi:DUF3995 domain-containing protein [Streptomyces bugieae]|uniref:DUF3995 domain-containing protein n=1 Tax=Streptomyces bugieae TaxID=3098223 RepID=A0ABU7NGU6_9ACTN|nr:DUF3995 domain-containing protein [Streptomyces sp. DSM 41528]